MRKYWKLLLIATAVISAAFFLFYKHQYDRLRGVLQVLDTFGSPNSATLSPVGGQLAWDGDGWLAVSSDLFIFSSYVAHGVGVVTLAAAVGEPRAEELSCTVWVEGAGASAGSVSVQRLPAPVGGAAPFAGWRLTCAFDGHRAPYAVGYVPRSAVGRRPAVSAVGRQDWPGPTGQLGLCLVPADWTSGDLDRLAEFVAFHAAVGLGRLWLYEAALSRGISQLLLRTATALPVRLVRWDFPFRVDSEAARRTAADLLSRDCMVRSSGHVAHVAAINVTQLIVPRRHETLQEMIIAMEEQTKRPQAAAFSLSQEVFCTDAPDGPHARASPFLTLSTKTLMRPALTERAAVLLLRPEAVADPFSTDAWAALGRPPQLNPVLAAVHLYADCGAAAGETSFEGAAVQFKSRLVSSPVYVTYRQLRDASLMGRAGPRPPQPHA